MWQPTIEQITSSNMYRFMKKVNQQYGTSHDSYDSLHEWSINNISEYWRQTWDFCSIIALEPYENIIDNVNKMPGAKWLEGATQNFAENLLRYRDDRLALIFRGEDKIGKTLLYEQLYDEVARVAMALKQTGVTVGE